MVDRVIRYREKTPLFEAEGVEDAIKSTLSRRVDLPSGGYLVFDYAEAFTVIDVNTGRFVGSRSKSSGGRLEDTITANNLEAVKEVVHQLRLRDIGGIIVIDFIDMANPKNRATVEEALKTELERDRTKTYVVEISPLGLVEMTRQNVTDGPREILTQKCPTCGGDGIVISAHSAAIDAERRLRDLAKNAKRGVEAFRVELEQNVASHLIGPGASRLTEIEALAKRRFFLEGKTGVPVDHFKVKAEGKLADIAPKAPVEEGAEIRLELVEVGQHDIAAGVGKLDGLTISVADGSKLVGKKVKVRIERVLNGAAYATLVQTAAQTAKMDAPITAESEAEKPTRAPRKKKVERGGQAGGGASLSATANQWRRFLRRMRRCRPSTRRPRSLRRRSRQATRRLQSRRRRPGAAHAAGATAGRSRLRGARRPPRTGRPTRRPTPAPTIHVPSPELGQTTDGAQRGRRAAAQEEANAPRLARRPQPAQEARSRFDRGQNRVVENKGPAECEALALVRGERYGAGTTSYVRLSPCCSRIEEAPLIVLEQMRVLLAEEPVDGRVSVGDFRAGDLVVAVVLAESAGRGVDRRRRVTALGQPANRLVRRVGVVLRDVEDPARVERVPLPVQRVARVLDERDQVVREERRVVESRPRPVAAVEDRQTCARARPACSG